MFINDNIKTEHSGYLIRGIRESKEVKQEVLCRGLCSRSMLARIEQGECTPDKILLDALFQRLGLSIHKFETLYTAEEYKCMRLRQQLINLTLREEFDLLRERIVKYKENNFKFFEKPLMQQFTFLIEALIEIRGGKKESNIERKIYKAINITCPDFIETKISKYLYHDEELNLILLLAEYLYKENHKERAINIYYSLLSYLEGNVLDKEELGRLYPKITLLLAEKLYNEKRYDELSICKKGIQLLKENGIIGLLDELLFIRLAGWEKEGNIREYNRNKDSYAEVIYGLKELNYGKVNPMEVLFLSPNLIAPGHIIGEQIRSFRNLLGITQEDLSDICDPATISRIEGGRKPHNRHYEEIMRRMGREGLRYYPFIKSNRYELHIARANLAHYINLQDYENAYQKLFVLEEELDGGEAINEQFLIKSRAILELEKKAISQEKFLERLIEALRLTAPVNVKFVRKEDEFRKRLSEEDLISLLEDWPLTQNELLIWNNIAITKGELGDNETKIQILSTIKDNYEKNKVSILHNAQGYLLITYNLANAKQTMGYGKEALHICENGIKISLMIESGYFLVGFLNIKAWCMKKIGMKKEDYLKVFKQAFSIADILDYKVMKNHIEKYCKDRFQVDIKTYFISNVMN